MIQRGINAKKSQLVLHLENNESRKQLLSITSMSMSTVSLQFIPDWSISKTKLVFAKTNILKKKKRKASKKYFPCIFGGLDLNRVRVRVRVRVRARVRLKAGMSFRRSVHHALYINLRVS